MYFKLLILSALIALGMSIAASAQSSDAPINQDLMVLVECADYDKWKSEAFDADSKRRSTVCDESRTTVAKISDTQAVILMYNVDMAKMPVFMQNEKMQALEKKYKVKHKVHQFTLLPPPPSK